MNKSGARFFDRGSGLYPSAAPPAKVIQVLKQRVSRRLRSKRRGMSRQLVLRFPGDPGAYWRFRQQRHYDFNVYSEKKLREKMDYMHGNPVKRRLVIRGIGRGTVGRSTSRGTD